MTSPQSSDRAERLLVAALDHAEEEREGFLALACKGDGALLEEVRDLLSARDAADRGKLSALEEDMDQTLPNQPIPPIPAEVNMVDLPTIKSTEPAAAESIGGSELATIGADPDAPVPFVFGQRIAQGGMGAILEADDCKLGRTIAAKVMLPDAGASKDDQKRFVQEAAVLGRLEHPNIVPIHDLGRDSESQLYYTMKMVQGRTLQEILNDLLGEDPDVLKEYTLERLLTVFRKICDAIAFAHSRNIVHRDLKPENIMVGEFGEVLVMDWGLSKILDGSAEIPAPGGEPADAAGSGSFTATLQGSVMGTPKYMSPEQARGDIDEIDQRSDVFSLGGILYAILTLRPPVEGNTLQEVLEKVSSANIEAPTALETTTGGVRKNTKEKVLDARAIKPLPHVPLGRVPSALSAVVMKALSLEKEDRYQDVAAFGEDIEKYQSGFATGAEQAGFATQLKLLVKRNKGAFATAFAAWLLITGLAVWFVFSLRASERFAKAEADRATNAEGIAVEKGAETERALARSALSLAEAALRDGDSLEMQTALNSVPEALRDSSWRFLLDQSDTSFVRIDTGVVIDEVVAHPQMPSVFVLVDRAGKVTVLNLRTGVRILEFESDRAKGKSKAKSYCLAISPNGEKVAIGRWGADTGRLVIHDTRDGKRVKEWEAKSTRGLEFSPDGQTLLQSEGELMTVNLWDATTAQLLWTHVAEQNVKKAGFSPDGSKVFVSAKYSRPNLLRADNGKIMRSVERQIIGRAAIAPDSKLIVVGSHTGVVRCTAIGGDKVLFEFRTDNCEIDWLGFTADNSRLVSIASLSDGRQSIRLWDAETGTAVERLLGGKGMVRGAAVHPLSGELVSCGLETRAWSLGGARWTLRGKIKRQCLAFFGGDETVFSNVGDESAALVQLSGPKPQIVWTAPDTGFSSSVVAVSEDESLVAMGKVNAPHPLLLFNNSEQGLKEAGKIQTRYGPRIIRISPTGKRLASLSGSGKGTLEVFDPVTGKQPVGLDISTIEQFSDLGWLSEERLLGLVTFGGSRGSSDSEERMVVWDVTSGEILKSATNPSVMEVLSVSPDHQRFVEAGADKRVRIRDASSLEVLRQFRAHDGAITALAWHPSEPVLATGSVDLTIRIWNLETGERIEELRGSTAAPHTLEFSPGGQRIGCASIDGATRIWDLFAPGNPSAALPVADEAGSDENRPDAGEAGGWEDPLSLLSSEIVEKTGNGWLLEKGVLNMPGSDKPAMLPLPGNYADTSYQVRVRLQATNPKSSFHLGLPVGDGMTGFRLNGWGGKYTGLERVDGKSLAKGPGVVEGDQVKDSRSHELEVGVLHDGANVRISATLDDRSIFEWNGPTASLSQGKDWTTASAGNLALGAKTEGLKVFEVKVKRLESEEEGATSSKNEN